MKRALMCSVVVLGLFSAANASAHNTRWSWAPRAAAQALYDDFAAVQSASCTGLGKALRTRHGRLYKHHSCFAWTSEGRWSLVFHVKSRSRYAVVWGSFTPYTQTVNPYSANQQCSPASESDYRAWGFTCVTNNVWMNTGPPTYTSYPVPVSYLTPL
jgi:hypothetical protein